MLVLFGSTLIKVYNQSRMIYQYWDCQLQIETYFPIIGWICSIVNVTSLTNPGIVFSEYTAMLLLLLYKPYCFQLWTKGLPTIHPVLFIRNRVFFISTIYLYCCPSTIDSA